MLQKISRLLLIKNGEQQQVLYFSALFFFIGAGMAIGRGASETLFFKRFGIEYLPLMYIITSVILCCVSLLYAAFVDRIPSEKFYRILFSILAILLVINWYTSRYLETSLVYPAFFLLYEVASELLLIHCAVYLTQNLVQTQSKRLTPVILSGFQVGIITGGVLLAVCTPYLGVENMILLWVILLASSFIILKIWHLKNGVSPYFRAGKKARSGISQSLSQITQGMKLMQSSKLLRMSSLSLFFLVISVYILAFSVNTVYTRHFTSEEALSSFFGLLTATTGIIALLIQLLFTNRLIHQYGVKGVNYIFPLSSILSYAVLLISFSLPAAIMGSFNKDTLMAAFAKPVRNIFNASLPEKIQGRAQAIAVIAVIPLGLASAGIFLLFTNIQNNIDNFLIAGLICSIALLLFSHGMNAAYAKEILSNLKSHLFIPENQTAGHTDNNPDYLLNDIKKGIMSDDDNVSLVYIKALINKAPGVALQILSQRIETAGSAYKDKAIKILHSSELLNITQSPESNLVKNTLGTGDKHLDATLLKILFQTRHAGQQALLAKLLNDNNTRLKAAGIYGVLSHPENKLIKQAINEWLLMIKNPDADIYLPAMELIIPQFKPYYQQAKLLPFIQDKLKLMLLDSTLRTNISALEILSLWSNGEINDIETAVFQLCCNENWDIRNRSLKILHLLTKEAADNILLTAIKDRHPTVRKNALKILAISQPDDIEYIQNILVNEHDGKYSTTPKTKRTMLEYLLQEGGDARTLHNISISLAENAVDLYHAREYFKAFYKNKSTAATILLHALNERIVEIAELALFATQSSDNDSEIAVIRAGLASNDKRQFSNACELLTLTHNKQLVELILPVFDDNNSFEKVKHNYPQFDNLTSVLSWIQLHSDSWLNECTSYFIKTENSHQHV